MESLDDVLKQLAELAERVKNGDVIGITIVTTSSTGKVDIETICYPPLR